MSGVIEGAEFGKGDFVLLDQLTQQAFMDNLRLRFFNFLILSPGNVLYATL